MPTVRKAEIPKKSRLFKAPSWLLHIKEKLPNNIEKFVSPAYFDDKLQNDLVIDKYNNLMMNKDYNQNLMNNKALNFQDKTSGMNGKISISHEPSKNSSNYPNQKNNVYE